MNNNNAVKAIISEDVIPDFLSESFSVGCAKTVRIQDLYVGLKSVTSRKTIYVNIKDTPHYNFVISVLNNVPEVEISGYKNYENYININPHPCSRTKFIDLINSMKRSGYDWENKPILVSKHWKRPFPLSRWDVLDGFHRFAVLAAFGQQKINVVTLRRKRNAFGRFLLKLSRRKANNKIMSQFSEEPIPVRE